jgi:hypothetical protein
MSETKTWFYSVLAEGVMLRGDFDLPSHMDAIDAEKYIHANLMGSLEVDWGFYDEKTGQRENGNVVSYDLHDIEVYSLYTDD